MSVAAADPVRAADDSVLVRQTIRALSQRYGMRVSFAPSVVAGHVGNGGHVHLSAWRDGRDLFAGGTGPHGMTAGGEAAAAGILRHLPALLAIGAPSPASYLRLVPSHWAGVFACWGLETRETALRLVTGNAGLEAAAANLEVKCFDLAANPYLLTGALVAAALGRAAERPPAAAAGHRRPGPVLRRRAGRARHHAGCPPVWTTRWTALAADETLRAALGDMLAGAVLAVRRAEADRVRDLPSEDVVSAFRWVF